MRLFNVDAILNVLNQMYKKPEGSEDYMTMGYDHAIADVIITLSRQPTIEVPEWIPMTEGCPDPWQQCWFTNIDGEIEQHSFDGAFPHYKAWMPFEKPEPYKGEKDE